MRFIGLLFPALVLGVACGQSDSKSAALPNGGGPAASAGNPGIAGSASDAGSNSGSAGQIAMAGTAGQGSSGAGNAPGGTAGDPEEGGSGSGGVGDGGGGEPAGDPRPGCDLAALIELSNLRLVEGAGPGEAAMLEVDVTNGTPDFVSYNPLKLTCTGAAVEHASDLLGAFGINAGGSNVVQLQVDFGDAAKPGDVARCKVRGFIAGKTPDDCANARTESLDVVVE